MKNQIFCLLFFLFITYSCKPTGEKINKTTPESLGISSEAILKFINALEKERPDDMHGFILLRHGKEVAGGWWEPNNAESRHMLYSLSKSFASTAIGITQDEGLLSINDSIMSFFPDAVPEDPPEHLKNMRIRDLLRMNTGHRNDATREMQQKGETWAEGFLSLPVEFKPGTRFVYNSGATYMLSAIIQKVTGQTLQDYLTPRLFEPLGIENPYWESNGEGVNFGGWGLNIRTRDIAKFGQLLLQKGKWGGKQLVSESWVKEATSLQTSNGSNPQSDWDQGYGYQFWRCRNNCYRGDGAFGQYCIVMPEQDAVLAINSGTSNMQAILNIVWEHLLPAFRQEPLAENMEDLQALNEKISTLSMSFVEGKKPSENKTWITEQVFTMENNDTGIKTIRFNFTEPENQIIFEHVNGELILPLGFREHKQGKFILEGRGEEPVGVCGAWVSDDHFRVRLYFYQTPYYVTHDYKFHDGALVFESAMNVRFGENKKVVLRGKSAGQ